MIEQQVAQLERDVAEMQRVIADLRAEPSLPIDKRMFSLKWPMRIQGPEGTAYIMHRETGGHLVTTPVTEFTKDDWSNSDIPPVMGEDVEIPDIIFDLPWAAMSIREANTAATTISDTGLFFDVNANPFTFNPASRDFTHSNGVLTYTGTRTREFVVIVPLSSTAAGANKHLEFRIKKNSATDVDSEAGRSIGTGTDEGAATCADVVEMAMGDTLNLAVKNETSTTNVTIVHMHFIVFALPGVVA